MFSKHRENKVISYSDFVMNKDKFLYTSSFNWEMNAYEIFKQWIPDLTDHIDSIMKYIQKADYVFSNDELKQSDSQMIRNCVLLYILRIFGIDQSEEFDYHLVNKMFPIDFKIYIKKIACYP